MKEELKLILAVVRALVMAVAVAYAMYAVIDTREKVTEIYNTLQLPEPKGSKE